MSRQRSGNARVVKQVAQTENEIFNFLQAFDGNWLIGLDFKRAKPPAYGEKKIRRFYRKMVEVLYDNEMAHPEKFQLVLFPEYHAGGKKRLHYHGIVRLAPTEEKLFRENYKKIWSGLTPNAARAYLKRDSFNDASDRVGYIWQLYITKENPDQDAYYIFG